EGRAVRPRHRRNPLRVGHQPHHRAGRSQRDGLRSDPAHHQRHRHPHPRHPHRQEPQKIPSPPHQLPPPLDHQHDRRGRSRLHKPRRPGTRDRQHTVPGRGLFELEVRTRPHHHPRRPPLQKACTAEQFDTNPAGCPPASIIGHAKAITPILPVPLEGPAYFVSHGGEAFPDLEIVLQGYGFTIDLTASTFISKAGVTSSTFKTVPDQPVTSFELTLPEGPFSALTAPGNLCSLTKTVTVKKKVTVKIHGRR